MQSREKHLKEKTIQFFNRQRSSEAPSYVTVYHPSTAEATKAAAKDVSCLALLSLPGTRVNL